MWQRLDFMQRCDFARLFIDFTKPLLKSINTNNMLPVQCSNSAHFISNDSYDILIFFLYQWLTGKCDFALKDDSILYLRLNFVFFLLHWIWSQSWCDETLKWKRKKWIIDLFIKRLLSPSVIMSTEDSNEAMDTIKVSEKSEKFLKTSLCQYYLAVRIRLQFALNLYVIFSNET